MTDDEIIRQVMAKQWGFDPNTPRGRWEGGVYRFANDVDQNQRDPLWRRLARWIDRVMFRR